MLGYLIAITYNDNYTDCRIRWPLFWCYCSVAQLYLTLWPSGLWHSRLPCPLLSPRVFQTHVHWVDDTTQLSHPMLPSSSPALNFPRSGSYPISWFFASGPQSIGAAASALVLPMNIQGRFTLRLAGWISLQSQGLSRVFPNTTVQKHQFYSAQISLWSNSPVHTWLLEKP